MNGQNFNITNHKPRILIAPLEWGLGHATRCIPLINELQLHNCTILIAAEGPAEALLKQEFPGLVFLTLQGYRMQYSRKKYWLPLKLLLQFPKVLASINNERGWLKKAVREHAIDAVISDNRFGLHHPGVPCIYITHQLTIKTGHPFTEWLAQKFHYRFVNRYKACWVPDAKGTENLAGELSHPVQLPDIPVHYIGPLSRFEKISAEKKYGLLAILSGPEPQRTIFEQLLLDELRSYSGKVLFVRGLPGNAGSLKSDSHIEIHNHLPAAALNQAMAEASLIISRSGYTTVMDLVKLGQKAILVPTPGQKEQEYLAAWLMKRELFYCLAQEDFSLKTAMAASAQFPFRTIAVDQLVYKERVKDFVQELNRPTEGRQ